MSKEVKKKPLIAAAGAIVFGLATVFILGATGILATMPDPSVAPDVQLTVGGEETISLAAPGHIVVLNFFASWCPPCRDEAPALRTTWAKLSSDGDVTMTGVIYKDAIGEARGYMRDYSLRYGIAEDEAGTLAAAFRVTGIPKTFVIAADGSIVLNHFGAVRAEQLLAAVEEARARGK